MALRLCLEIAGHVEKEVQGPSMASSTGRLVPVLRGVPWTLESTEGDAATMPSVRCGLIAFGQHFRSR